MASLSNILAGLHKTIRKLDALVEKNNALASELEDKIVSFRKRVDELDDETYQAEQVRDRIKDLISVE